MTPQPTPFDYDLEKLPTKRMGGIDPRVVQLILEEGRDEWRKMELKVAELQERINRYEDERSSVNNALILAQKSADDVLRQAQYKAEAILDEARGKSVLMEEEHRQAIKDTQQELEQITLTKQRFADEFRALLKGYLSELDARFPAGTTMRHRAPKLSEPTAEEETPLETVPRDPDAE